MGKKKKSKGPAMVKFEHIVKDMVVVLKRDQHCKVVKTESSMTKRKGVKITVFATAIEGGEEVKEVKPAERLTQLISAPEGYVAGAVVEEEEEVAAKKDAFDTTIDTTSSGASLTVPIRAGEVKKGGIVMLKEKPCKVISVTTSKTGKHGHAKANMVGIDIFTGQKKQDISPCSHTMYQPVVSTLTLSCTDIIDEGDDSYCVLMNDNGEIREDLKLPRPDAPDKELGEKIRGLVEEGKDVMCVITIAPANDKAKEVTEIVTGMKMGQDDA